MRILGDTGSLGTPVDYLELYAFMSKDVRHLFAKNGGQWFLEINNVRAWARCLRINVSNLISNGTFHLNWRFKFGINPYWRRFSERWLWPTVTVAKWLGALGKSDAMAVKVAQELNASLGEKCPPIEAVCTFFPGLGNLGEDCWRESVDALRGLLKLVGAMREFPRMPVNVIEVVAGSRLHSHRVKAKGEEIHGLRGSRTRRQVVADVASVEKGVGQLLRALSSVVDVIPDGTFIAVEMEPGPIFVLGEWDSLRLFRNRLVADFPHLLKHVLFNVDVSHWRLAGITVKQLEEDAVEWQQHSIAALIGHIHLSDCGKGHLCDVLPGTGSESDELMGWLGAVIDLMDKYAVKGVRRRRISWEFEMAPALDWAKIACDRVA